MSYFLSTAGRVVSCVLYLITGLVSGGIMVMFMGMQGSWEAARRRSRCTSVCWDHCY
jgi:hypothetical protein